MGDAIGWPVGIAGLAAAEPLSSRGGVIDFSPGAPEAGARLDKEDGLRGTGAARGVDGVDVGVIVLPGAPLYATPLPYSTLVDTCRP